MKKSEKKVNNFINENRFPLKVIKTKTVTFGDNPFMSNTHFPYKTP